MGTSRFTEFLTVLAFAMVAGAATMLAILYLDDTPRVIALVAIGAATIASWNYLRKRFGRGR